MGAAEILKQKVNALMAQRGWTSNKPLIDASDRRLSNGTLGRIRSAGTNCTLAHLEELAAVFHVPVHSLLDPTPAPAVTADIAVFDASGRLKAVTEVKASTLGQIANSIADQLTHLPDSRREKIAGAFGKLIRSGPDIDEATDIDALAPSLTIDPTPSWREILHGYIDALDAGPDRDLLEAVFAAVDAKHAELAHQKDAKSVGKITHPLGG